MNPLLRLFVLFALVSTSLTSSAQKEFFITVDPTAGTFTRIDSIPGLMWISVQPRSCTYDEVNKEFFFQGTDRQGVRRLYTINALTGATVNNPPFPVLPDPIDNIIEIQHHHASGTMYAVHWDHSAFQEYLVTVDPVTGQHTIVAPIPDVWSIETALFDQTNGHYLLRAGDTLSNQRLYTIDVATGNIISNPILAVAAGTTDRITNLQLDHSTGTLYGLYWHQATFSVDIITINQSTGQYSVLHPVPGIDFAPGSPNFNVFDEANGHYIFRTGTQSGDWRLRTVDIATGAVLSDPLFPVLTEPIDNLNEFRMDQSSGIIYGLHWDNVCDGEWIGLEEPTESPELTVFPNPIQDQATIRLKHLQSEANLRLVDGLGRVVMSWSDHTTQTIELQNDQLAPGVYFLEVRSEGERLVERVVVQ